MVKTGGGYGSAKQVEAKKGKQEVRSRAVSPAAVAQQGASTQFRKEELYQGRSFQPIGPKDHTAVGPGAGRTIHPSGSQSATPDREMPKGTDILSQYGPERRR